MGGQGRGGRGRPSTLAVPVYTRAQGADPQPAPARQQLPHLPSCWVLQLGPAFSLSLLPTPSESVVSYRHLCLCASSRGAPSSGTGVGALAGAWDCSPALHTEGSAMVPKAPVQPQGLGDPGQCGMQGLPACPGHCCYCHCYRPPAPPRSAWSQECPQTAQPPSGSPVSIYLELALPSLTQGLTSRGWGLRGRGTWIPLTAGP